MAREHVRSTNPGACYQLAGFHRVSERPQTKLGPMIRWEMDSLGVATCLDAVVEKIMEGAVLDVRNIVRDRNMKKKAA